MLEARVFLSPLTCTNHRIGLIICLANSCQSTERLGVKLYMDSSRQTRFTTDIQSEADILTLANAANAATLYSYYEHHQMRVVMHSSRGQLYPERRDGRSLIYSLCYTNILLAWLSNYIADEKIGPHSVGTGVQPC